MTAAQAITLAASEELRPFLEKPWLPKREREAAEMRARALLDALKNRRRRNSKFVRDRVEKILSAKALTT
jgi:hypothetical protein